MTSSQELDDLMEQSIRDFRQEPAFFRALLDATIYAHVPLKSPSEWLHFVLFKSPDDGELVIPVFTDEAKAHFAARGNVLVVSMKGRKLFDATRGATVMINPNDARCTLYPEEIAELLASGTVASMQTSQIQESETRCYKLNQVPQLLAKTLKKKLPEIRTIEAVYIAGLRRQQPDHPDGLLIGICGSADKAEREVRAIAMALRRALEQLARPVDVVHFGSSEAKPEWIRRLKLAPVYRRRLSQSVSKYH